MKTHYKQPTKKEIEAYLLEALQLTHELELVKPHYKRLDSITELLLGAGIDADYLAPYGIALIDNFASKNTQFKASFVRRFELHFPKREKVMEEIRRKKSVSPKKGNASPAPRAKPKKEPTKEPEQKPQKTEAKVIDLGELTKLTKWDFPVRKR